MFHNLFDESCGYEVEVQQTFVAKVCFNVVVSTLLDFFELMRHLLDVCRFALCFHLRACIAASETFLQNSQMPSSHHLEQNNLKFCYIFCKRQ